MPFKIVIGDYTEIQCDALVNFYLGAFGNASNVSTHIQKIGGAEFSKEYKKIEKCSIGKSVISNAFGVKARYMIHTVAPINSKDFEHNLASCYKSSFCLCEKEGLLSITYPLIISNQFPIPIEKAIKIALNRISTNLLRFNENIFVCLVVPDKETFNLTLAIAKDILPKEYYTVDEMPISSKESNTIYSTNERLQISLIENYESQKGALTETQLGIKLYNQWSIITRDIYDQLIILKEKEWSNPTELKTLPGQDAFWNSIKHVFRDMIGDVNEYSLTPPSDIICLLMAYAMNGKVQSDEARLNFRTRFEYYIARLVIEQKNKTAQILKDEKRDRNDISRLRGRTPKAKQIDEPEQEEASIWENNSVLYIYKGNIRCHRFGHNIIQATAVLHNKTDVKFELNVEYCTDCEKFILEYTIFEEYRKNFGNLIGNFRLVTNGDFNNDYTIAQESPLMLSGYTVNQQDGFSSNERHYILARLIHDKIMSKGEIIRYLSYFIRKNGAKSGNEIALSKWQEDLDFVQKYNINIQPRVIISDIRKY